METLCTPKGVECYKNMTLASSSCLIPCKGLYADIDMKSHKLDLEEMEVFEKVLEHYEGYKRAYDEDISYPQGMIKCLFNCKFD